MSPRIAYVFLNLISLAGLDDAIQAQGRATLREGGANMDIYVLCEKDGMEQGVRFVRVRTASSGLLATWQRRFFKYALLSQLEAFRTYDVVVMRYVPAIDLAPSILHARSCARIATVHHAKEQEEVRRIGGRVRAFVERKQSPAFLERVQGIVGVTDEIRDYQLRKVRTSKPAATVSNGIDVERITPTGFAPAGPEVQVAFMASAYAPWHGVDRLFRGLESYRGQRRIHLHVIGGGAPEPPRVAPGGPVTISQYGLLRGAALDDVLRRCTIGVSSLALFRTGLRQGAVLKTRDYMARGLPFAYGYEEVDVPSDAPFALRVPDAEEEIDIEKLIEFADTVSARPEFARDMRAFAAQKLDWGVKLKQLAQFAATLA